LFNKMMKSIEVNKNLWAAMVCIARSVRLVPLWAAMVCIVRSVRLVPLWAAMVCIVRSVRLIH